MIISASRRTDIPAYFSEWFLNRIEAQYAYVRNPINIRQVSRISLSPDLVDCIVFWSKNPEPLMDRLKFLDRYMYYFQFTLNAYGTDIERNLPALDERIRTFQALSNLIGRQRVIWRYDPILLNDRYTIDWHIERFNYIAGRLYPYTEKVTISFIDLYRKIATAVKRENIQELSFDQKNVIAKEFARAAHACQLIIDTCAEDIDLSRYQIEHARCIDGELISRLLGCPVKTDKDKNQRPECGCMSSIDLGLYNTCQNGCIYCYANHNTDTRIRNYQAYDPASPLLCGQISKLDKVTERKIVGLAGSVYGSNDGLAVNVHQDAHTAARRKRR